jgi:KDO2-lipid IV(A) lauroyltransferase
MVLGRWIGHLLYLRIKRRVNIARTNIRLCFPNWSNPEREELVKQHFHSAGMGMMEVGLCWWGNRTRLLPMVEISGEEHLRSAFARGKGVIFLTAHFTSFELSGLFTAPLAPLHPMYRPHENPVINRLMTSMRQKRVGPTIARDDVRSMVKALKDNKGIWFAPDQNFGHKGSEFADFFGVPAATNTSTCRFAKMTGAAVLPYVVLRKPDNSGYRMIIEAPMEAEVLSNPQLYAQEYNRLIMHWCEQGLPQYNWMHRRFKTRPQGEARFY